MNKKQAFNQKLFLDQLGSYISKDNYEESLQKLRELCIYHPFRTQIFVQVFIQAWCEKIINMFCIIFLFKLEDNSLDVKVILNQIQ